MVGPEQKAWADRKVPPVTGLWMLSLALIAGGVSYLAAYLPSAIVLGMGVVLLAREREFAWQRFRQVAGWTLLAYIVIAGMIEYAFIYDHTHGAVLVVMTLMLLVFMLAPPLLVGFTVARFQHIPGT